jgi:Right handed beta helix region
MIKPVRQSAHIARLVRAVSSAAAYCMMAYAASAAGACNQIAPSQRPVENYNTIKQCLASSDGIAKLAEGIFQISQKITMPPKSKLFGAGKDKSIIVAARSPGGPARDSANQLYPSNSVLETTDDNVVDQLALTGNSLLHEDCCTSVVAITGSRSRLTNLEIFDLDPATMKVRQGAEHGKATGIYFIGAPQSVDNLVDNNVIHDVSLGVVFRAGLPREKANTISNSSIHDIYCDGITFAGYGISNHNLISESGFECGQTPIPIPGAGIYSLNNADGGKITYNIITDICGNGVDFDNAEKFELENNTITLTGSSPVNKYKYCGAGSPGSFAGIRSFVVKNNQFIAIDLVRLGTFFNWFPAYKSDNLDNFYPLPDRDKKIMAVKLLKTKRETANNVFDNNFMQATCTKAEICEGVGLYVGPGTGGDLPGNVKGAAQVNSFTRNRSSLSNIGSLRCGRNWYAADSACAHETGGTTNCNDDDYQHVAGTSSDGFRNDHCLAR